MASGIEEGRPSAAVRVGRPAAATAAVLETRILDAAWQVMEQCGAELFSIDQVAQQAHTSKRTIYSRFGSKQSLIRRMVDRGVGDYLAALRQRFDEQGLGAMLEAHATLAFQYMSSPAGQALTRLIDTHTRQNSGGGETIARSSHRTACAGVEAMLRDAATRGEIAVDDPAFAASFWVESLIGHARVGVGTADDITAWARVQTKLFLRALRP